MPGSGARSPGMPWAGSVPGWENWGFDSNGRSSRAKHPSRRGCVADMMWAEGATPPPIFLPCSDLPRMRYAAVEDPQAALVLPQHGGRPGEQCRPAQGVVSNAGRRVVRKEMPMSKRSVAYYAVTRERGENWDARLS